MNTVERNLLIRIARRLEEYAEASYNGAKNEQAPKEHEAAKRRRDRELGDAKDLRDLVGRANSEQAAP